MASGWHPAQAPAELVTLADLDRGQASALLSLLLDCFPVGEWPAENPLDIGTRIGHLGGTLNTLVNEQLTIVSQIPEPRAVLSPRVG